MLRSIIRLVVVAGLVGILILMLPAIVSVAGPQGSGPDDVFAPEGAWEVLQSGEEVWYAFNYDGDSGQIMIHLDVEPNDGAEFTVHTPDQGKLWREQGKLEQIGSGGHDKHAGSDLSWTGNFDSDGAYYVVVKGAEHRQAPFYYSLKVDGAGVSMPLATAEPVVATASIVAAPEPVAVAETMAGYGPDDAMAPNGEWLELAEGEAHWYAMNYDGKEGQIQVNLSAEPAEGIKSSVRTPEEVKYWQDTGEMKACGCGAANSYEEGDLFWSGAFPNDGVYYLVVESDGDGSAFYALDIDGAGVWF
ncbi:MAG: hypothetical protein GY759_03585 [Chloroflexi bacterium]|nr:hypothetical protein [Chloroflexota bacterium]